MLRLAAVLIVLVGCVPLDVHELRARQIAAAKQGDTFEAIRFGKLAVERRPDDVGTRYDLACSLALAADEGEALTQLEKAVELGFDDVEHLAEDPDLRSLRANPRFAAAIARAEVISKFGIEVPQTRTIVRDDAPMRLRLRLPDVSQGKLRVAVWLHPSGSRFNSEIEWLAPVLFAHGLALVVPTELYNRNWSTVDFDLFVTRSLPVFKNDVDLERPVLIGFSAGGQIALIAWAQQPDRFGAVIATATAATVPLDQLPGSGAPVVVVNGARDPAFLTWGPVLSTWRSGSRKVSMRVVPDRFHEWVIDAALLGEALETVGFPVVGDNLPHRR